MTTAHVSRTLLPPHIGSVDQVSAQFKGKLRKTNKAGKREISICTVYSETQKKNLLVERSQHRALQEAAGLLLLVSFTTPYLAVCCLHSKGTSV